MLHPSVCFLIFLLIAHQRTDDRHVIEGMTEFLFGLLLNNGPINILVYIQDGNIVIISSCCCPRISARRGN